MIPWAVTKCAVETPQRGVREVARLSTESALIGGPIEVGLGMPRRVFDHRGLVGDTLRGEPGNPATCLPPLTWNRTAPRQLLNLSDLPMRAIILSPQSNGSGFRIAARRMAFGSLVYRMTAWR